MDDLVDEDLVEVELLLLLIVSAFLVGLGEAARGVAKSARAVAIMGRDYRAYRL